MNDTQGERSLGQPKVIDGILDEHARLAGDIVKIDPHTWAIHGYIPVDGEVLLAEFDGPENARVALERLSAAESSRAAAADACQILGPVSAPTLG